MIEWNNMAKPNQAKPNQPKPHEKKADSNCVYNTQIEMIEFSWHDAWLVFCMLFDGWLCSFQFLLWINISRIVDVNKFMNLRILLFSFISIRTDRD